MGATSILHCDNIEFSVKMDTSVPGMDPNYLIPVPFTYRSSQKRKMEAVPLTQSKRGGSVRNVRERRQLGKGDADSDSEDETDEQSCHVCSRTFSRPWTLKRHIEKYHPGDAQHGGGDGDEESMDEDKDNESAPETSAENLDYMEKLLPTMEIERIRHLVAIGELGDVKLNQRALLSFIPGLPIKEKSVQDSDDEDEELYEFRPQSLACLRELLSAARTRHLNLTRQLYVDIVNAMDLTGNEDQLDY